VINNKLTAKRPRQTDPTGILAMSNIAISDDSLLLNCNPHVSNAAASPQTGKLATVSSLRSAIATLEAEEETPVATQAPEHRHRQVRPCCNCKGRLIRISRTSLAQYMVSCFGVYPYVCEHCEVRVFRSNYKQLVAAICLRGLTLGLLVIGLTYADLRIRKITNPWKSLVEVATFPPEPTRARASTPPRALTNDDIVEFIKSNMTPGFVMRVIQQEGSHFEVDATSLTALKRNGVPEDVIIAMIQEEEALSERGNPRHSQR